MVKPNAPDLLEKLAQLRVELVELAYTLDTRGRLDAADVAISTSARIGELCEEFATAHLSQLGSCTVSSA